MAESTGDGATVVESDGDCAEAGVKVDDARSGDCSPKGEKGMERKKTSRMMSMLLMMTRVVAEPTPHLLHLWNSTPSTSPPRPVDLPVPPLPIPDNSAPSSPPPPPSFSTAISQIQTLAPFSSLPLLSNSNSTLAPSSSFSSPSQQSALTPSSFLSQFP